MTARAAENAAARCKADNWLKSWALGIARRSGARKAKVALARRLAVSCIALWRDGAEFSMERPIAMNPNGDHPSRLVVKMGKACGPE
ncbi:MAG: hypothetical protein EOS85_06635 [Mesorhizobium sp.]|nr:MAG: hypothetical protein EOS85_06635 [Mesorhizobium sp.]